MDTSSPLQSSQLELTPIPKRPATPKPRSYFSEYAKPSDESSTNDDTYTGPPEPPNQHTNIISSSNTTNKPSLSADGRGGRPPIERVVEHGVLRSPRTLVFKARKEKRYNLSCPLDLRKYSITIKKLRSPGIYQYTIVMVLTMFVNFWMNQEGTSSSKNSPLNQRRSSNNRNISMSFISWNCCGAGNAGFKRAFRSMLDYHKPNVVALLETRLADHHNIMEYFGFLGQAQVPAQGNSGGMALMWNNDEVNVDQIGGTDQEIHSG
ncbi:hypothetical protein A4A49_60788 [Nicotiana attenuata]|uniref:Endonuclease/exonuclease/phosphatase domain-containing protein n=1 Tax=Nicotiana attenuata TaxID=49451 RepID=A0A314KPK0_NICAT|nr:hypothetical protein A4A49_60788 [Nicotiana attenuata]